MATKTALATETLSTRRHDFTQGGPVLGSRGEVLVSDSRYAHHLMSPRALQHAKFSPGLGQQEEAKTTHVNIARARPHAQYKRQRYGGENVGGSGTWGALNQPLSSRVSASRGGPGTIDEDDELVERERAAARRRGLGATEESLLAAIEAQKAAAAAAAAQHTFSPKALKAAAQPTVPRAADAALHQPGGGGFKVFSQKLDLSSVTPRVAIAAPTAPTAKHDPTRPRADVFEAIYPVSGRRRYNDVAPKVPTAASALEHKPAGGNVALPPKPALPWLSSPDAVAPLVPTAASAASHRPRAPTVSIFSAKVDFASSAAPRAVPAQHAKQAASYVPKGGQVDVFLWRRPPESRREPPPKKTEAQILEELFPTSAAEAEAEQQQQRYDSRTSTEAHISPVITARRRRGELAM